MQKYLIFKQTFFIQRKYIIKFIFQRKGIFEFKDRFIIEHIHIHTFEFLFQNIFSLNKKFMF